MPVQSPILHTVYAGYGDSLLLEFSTLRADDPFNPNNLTEHRHLVIIDGGPGFGYGSNRLYPYPKYFVAAVRRVWQSMRVNFPNLSVRPSPTAIINSHPDHDHTHGLYALLVSAVATGDMVFEGPLLSTVYRKRLGAYPTDRMYKAIVFRDVVREIYPQWYMGRVSSSLSITGLNMVYPQMDATHSRVIVYASDATGNKIPIPNGGPMEPGELEPENGVTLPQGVDGWLRVNWSNAPITNENRDYKLPTPSIDESQANLGSILLETVEATTGGRIALTGDSGAEQIVGAWKMQDPTQPRQRFSIYKLSHHGSIKNNMFVPNGYKTYVTPDLLWESAMRELLDLALGPWLTTPVDAEINTLHVAYFALQWLEVETDLLNQGGRDYLIANILSLVFQKDKIPDYLTVLRHRHKWHLMRLLDHQRFINENGEQHLQNWEENFKAVIAFPPDPAKPHKTISDPGSLLAYIRNWIHRYDQTEFQDKSRRDAWVMTHEFIDVKDKNGNFTGRVMKVRPWWRDFANPYGGMQTWGAVYATIEEVLCARSFFGMFDADAYVVSANGHHGHPNEATIAGLALALLLDNNNPNSPNAGPVQPNKRLYLTNGWSVEPDYLIRMLSPHKPANAADGWTGLEALDIHYLAKGSYFSLDGATFIAPNANRELTGRTRRYIVDDAAEQTRIKQVHDILERDRAVLPGRVATYAAYYIQFMNTQLNGQDAYLAIVSGLDNGIFPTLRPMDENLRAVGVLDVFETVIPTDVKPTFLNGSNGAHFQVEAHDDENNHWEIWANTNTSDNGFFLQWLGLGGEFWGLFAKVGYYPDGLWHYTGETETRRMADMIPGNPELVPTQYPTENHSWYLEHAWFRFVRHEPPVQQFVQQQQQQQQQQNNQGQMRMMATTLPPPIPPMLPLPVPVSTTTPTPPPVESSPLQGQLPRHTIGEYLTAIAYRTDPAAFTIHDVLLILLGYDRMHSIDFYADMHFTLALHMPIASPSTYPVEHYILSAPMDLAASWVRFTTSAHRVDVLDGRIVAKVDSYPHTAHYHGQPRVMAEAYFEFSFSTTGRLEYSYHARPRDAGVPVFEEGDAHDDESVPADRKTSLLVTFLEYATKKGNIATPELGTLTLPKLLAFLCNQNSDTWWNNPRNPFFDTFLGHGLLGFKPELDRSRVHVDWSPTGRFCVHRAEIVLTPSGSPYNVALAGLAGVLQHPVLTITDAGLSNQQISISCSLLIGTNTLKVTSGDGGGYTATTADQTPTLTITLQGGTDLASIAALWPSREAGLETVSQTTLPFTNDRPLLSLSQTGAGVVLAKLCPGDVSYTVRNLFAAVSLSDVDWKAWLPESVSLPDGLRGSVRVELRDPFEADTRVVGVIVEFQLPIRDDAAHVHVSLSALPLMTDSRYDYRLAIQSPGYGVSVAEILSALGMAGQWDALKTAYPTLTSIAEGVIIKTFAVSLVKSGTGTGKRLSIGGYVVELAIPGLTIIPGIVELYNVTLTAIDDNGVRDIRGSGTLQLGGQGGYNVAVEFALPTITTPGILEVSLTQGSVSAETLASHGKLSDLNLSVLPLFDSMTTDGVPLSRAVLMLGYSKSTDQHPSLISASIDITSSDHIRLGDWEFENISASIEHYTVLATGGKPAATSYDLSAVTVDGTFIGRIGYDTFNSRLEVLFVPRQVVKLYDAVKSFIGDGVVTNVLEAVMSDMGVKAAHVAYNVSTKAVEVAVLELVDTATLLVGYTDSQKAAKTRALTGLRLQYTAATATVPAQFYLRAKTSGTNASALFFVGLQWDNPTTKTLAVSLRPEEGKTLTMTGALSIFDHQPTNPKTVPDGLDLSGQQWWDLDIKVAEGSIKLTTDSVTQKNVITLSTLDVQVELTRAATLWSNVILKKLQVHVRYHETAGLDAYLSADVAVGSPEAATLSMTYMKDSTGTEVWSGSGALVQTLSPQELGEKIAGVPGTGVYKLPADQSLPAQIPLANLDIVLRRGKSLQVTGTVNGGYPAWLPPLLGVSISATNLGMQFLVTAKTSPAVPPATVGVTTYKYEAWLIADVKLSGFQTAKAQFSIPLNGEFVLTAQLLKERPTPSISKTIAFADISSQVASAGKTTKINDLVPIGQITDQLDGFGATAVSLYANFTTKHFVLAGGIEGQSVGAVFLAKQTKPAVGTTQAEYGYFVSFAASNPQVMWADVASAFNVSKVEANIVALEATVGSLQADLQLALQTLGKVPDPKRVEVASTTTDGVEKTLALLQDKERSLDQGSWFFATLDPTTTTADEKPMMSTVKLGLSSTAPSPPKIVVWGLVKPTTASSYGLQITDYRLVGDAITITGALSYAPPPAGAPDTTVSIQGRATAIIIGLSEPPLTLSVTWQQSKKSTKFNLTGTPPQTVISAPFNGDMFNVRMASWSLNGTITRTTNNTQTAVYSLKCNVALGTATEYSLSGEIVFVNGVPRIAVVTYGPHVKIDEVYGQIIKPGATNPKDWPGEYHPFTLLSARLYYAQHTAEGWIDVADVRYFSGYHIEAKVQFLGRNFGVSVHLPAKNDRRGIVLKGTYEEKVDFGFMVLEGFVESGTVAKTKGMTATVDTTGADTIYKVEAGLTLFGFSGFKVDLLYLPPDGTHPTWGLKGTAHYQGTEDAVLEIPYPSLGFIYRDGKFALEGWQMLIKDVQDLLDLKKAIEAASAEDHETICGKLVGLLFGSAVKTRVRVFAKLDFPDPGTDKVTPPSVLLKGTASFEVLFNVTQIASVDFDWPIEIAFARYNSDGLYEAIKDTIIANTAEIGRAFYNDPVKLTAVIGVLKVESWAHDLLAALVCRGVKPPNVHKPVLKHKYDKEVKTIEKIINTVKNIVDKVKYVLTITFTELIALGEELLAAIVAFGAALKVVMEIFSELWHYFDTPEEKKKYQEETDALKAKKQEAQQELAGLKDKLRRAMTLTGQPVAVYPGTDIIKVDWNDKMPNPPVFPNDNLIGIVWTVRYGLNEDRDHLSNQQTQFSAQTGKFTWQNQNAMWIPKPHGYVWIKAHCVMNDETISTPWVAAVPVVDSVLRVRVKLLDPVTYTQSVVITIPKPAKMTYQVCMATNNPPGGGQGTVVLSFPVTQDNLPYADFTVNWADIKPLVTYDPLVCTLLRTYTRQLTSQHQANATLGWTEVGEKIQFYKGASAVTAWFSSGTVTVDWRQHGSVPAGGDDFAIKLTRNGVPVSATRGARQSTPAGSRKVVFTNVVDQAISMVAEITAHPPPGTDTTTIFCIPFPCPVVHTPPPSPTVFASNVNLAGNMLKNGDFSLGLFSGWTVNPNNNPVEIRSPGAEGRHFGFWTNVIGKSSEAYSCTQLTQWVDCEIGKRYRMTIRWRFGSSDNNSYLNCHLDHGDGIVSVRSGDNGAWRQQEGEFTATKTRHEIVVNMLGTWYRGMPWEIAFVKLEKLPEPVSTLTGSLLKNGDFATGTTAFWTVNNNNNPIEVRTPGFDGQRYKLWTNVIPKSTEPYACTQLTQWVDCQVGASYKMSIRWRFGSADNNSYLNCHLDHGDGIISVRSGDNGALRTAEGQFVARQTRHEIVVNMLGTWYRGMPWEISWVKLVKV